MKISNTYLSDIFIIDLFSFKDNRGEFVKTIHDKTFEENGLVYQFAESFYSISNKDVIRGMHFQKPPYDHVKFVYVVSGKILDVVIDLRMNSITYGKSFQIELSEENRKGIYIGKGFAHGFLALEDKSIVEYHTSISQNKEAEAGILYNSFNFDWPVEFPVVSVRDKEFLSLTEFKTPF
ncbi:dTDP-4-dehydrorhamnose 3,5-epimerase/CDP-3, 6-dideoxy-D-glycero-D-glycero-4-hexulose-5-epimerase [Mucilaginibacter frigoritolerans]|jgi:dTDP-4-dehydrorhamnose 3,5-epimerase|uniref:dTDP-4-dehydrorhamnose 3,5-epimerase n=1 Tax=Mucilaginibacter frigoritolerans TaxID=652788 RepID=A0A562TKQ3_9SPHI|nr:dTDP-4-dehydrorhamnose 3,5-epimerase family protein [Mucilaginibacter frigoritolerans]TWI93808.1 dTDP-4-dehydrorhamnose 3,5-epimerase/CDP-3, 6-dideoxy-D-glycero-D-glycero-4-hexulose-5-epimerase [Mucilaginibacter frigoritolerans]